MITPAGNMRSLPFSNDNELPNTETPAMTPDAKKQFSEIIEDDSIVSAITDNPLLESTDTTVVKEIVSQHLGRLDAFLSARFVFDDLKMYTPTIDTAVTSCFEGIATSRISQPDLVELLLQSIPLMICADYVVELLKVRLSREDGDFFSPANVDKLTHHIQQTEALRAEKQGLLRLFSTGVDPRELKPILDSPSKDVFKQALVKRKPAFDQLLRETTQQRGN